MTNPDLTPCPGCAVRLPESTGPSHRYIGALPACWAIYTALLNGGSPPLAPHPLNELLIDAYAAQHPGTPSAQATQSVAVHLLALCGVLDQGLAAEQALWVRRRALRLADQSRRDRFVWLDPPPFMGQVTVVDIVEAATPAARTAQVDRYVHGVWAAWQQVHVATIRHWYEQFVLADRL